MPAQDRPRIDAARLWTRLMTLAEIGATAAGGVDRQALTEEEIPAWRQVIAWGEAAGLLASADMAGNLFLTLPGLDRDAAPVLAGSHLDTQPTGGRFDGVTGVLAALEAVTAFAEAHLQPARDVTVVAWMNEEGSRFAPGMMGSEAFAGIRSLETIRKTRDGQGLAVGPDLDRLLAAFPALQRRPLGGPVHRYLELHIEQGPLLEQAGCGIGIVTGIQGKRTYEVTIDGREGHAGTLAMAERQDALAAFASVADALFRTIGTHDPLVKFTVGRLNITPNAPSVVPSRAVFSIDLRHPDNVTLDAAHAQIMQLDGTTRRGCTVRVLPLVNAPSNVFDAELQSWIAEAAAAQGYSAMPILSAAGHDARHLAALCRSAMIFIPCRDGISHAENEWAEPVDVAAGAAVLATLLHRTAWA